MKRNFKKSNNINCWTFGVMYMVPYLNCLLYFTKPNLTAFTDASTLPLAFSLENIEHI